MDVEKFYMYIFFCHLCILWNVFPPRVFGTSMVEEYEEIADPSERPDDPDDDLGKAFNILYLQHLHLHFLLLSIVKNNFEFTLF